MGLRRCIVCANGLRVKARLADGCHCGRDGIGRCVNCQSARTQLKPQAAYAGDGGQRASDFAFFGSAVEGKPGYGQF